MIKGGFNPKQLITLPNFINDKKLNFEHLAKENHYCYVGRLSTEKGIETLLKAAAELPQYELKVIGTGPLESDLKSKYTHDHIKFLGFKNWEDLKHILESSRCMIIPSECYENNPLSVIESLCLGTPVIGTNIGGIPELIIQGKNGFTFESGNVLDLKKYINHLFQTFDSFNYFEIAETAKAKFNSENYYKELLKIYNKVIAK
jgi:glycosyltransferase involved in cell wall biosynthesis